MDDGWGSAGRPESGRRRGPHRRRQRRRCRTCLRSASTSASITGAPLADYAAKLEPKPVDKITTSDVLGVLTPI